MAGAGPMWVTGRRVPSVRRCGPMASGYCCCCCCCCRRRRRLFLVAVVVDDVLMLQRIGPRFPHPLLIPPQPAALGQVSLSLSLSLFHSLALFLRSFPRWRVLFFFKSSLLFLFADSTTTTTTFSSTFFCLFFLFCWFLFPLQASAGTVHDAAAAGKKDEEHLPKVSALRDGARRRGASRRRPAQGPRLRRIQNVRRRRRRRLKRPFFFCFFFFPPIHVSPKRLHRLVFKFKNKKPFHWQFNAKQTRLSPSNQIKRHFFFANQNLKKENGNGCHSINHRWFFDRNPVRHHEPLRGQTRYNSVTKTTTTTTTPTPTPPFRLKCVAAVVPHRAHVTQMRRMQMSRLSLSLSLSLFRRGKRAPRKIAFVCPR